jgi:hypothetical protein
MNQGPRWKWAGVSVFYPECRAVLYTGNECSERASLRLQMRDWETGELLVVTVCESCADTIIDRAGEYIRSL